MTTLFRPRRTAVRAALAAALIVLIALLATACGDDEGTAAGDPTAVATTAPAPESPAAVVTAYLSAVQDGDVEAARALATDRFAEETDAAQDSWFHQDVAFADIALGDPEPAGGSATASRFADAVYVPARFDLTQSAPDSLPNGATVWGFTLGRNSDADPWRIDGAGRG